VPEVRHLILLARSVTGQHDDAGVRRLAAGLSARRPEPVHAAFLEGAAPGLHEVLDRCASAGATRVTVLPAHVPTDRGLLAWAGRAIAHWCAGAGPAAPLVEVAGGPEEEGLLVALAAAADGAAAPPDAAAAAFASPEWDVLPDPRAHILLCQGPRCTARGAGTVRLALNRRLHEHGVGETEILVTRTACLFPCNLGPVALVHPDAAWHTALDPDGVRRLVDNLLSEHR
jgi:(2Fe-2S) ferredoxin